MRKSRAVGEVVSSVAMLVVTMAVLGGLAVLSLGSLRSADNVLLSGSQNAENDAGLLLTVVSSQSNSSGTYVWLFNYGWTAGRLSSVYLNGGALEGWTSSCSSLPPKTICSVALPPDTHGAVSILFGTRSIGLTL